MSGTNDALNVAGRPPRVRRRDFLKASAGALALMVSPVGNAAAASILARRVWPARDYTRVTLEGQPPQGFNYFTVKNPERLVVDLEGVVLNSVLQSLPSKIGDSDPYIKLIRAGLNKPGTVRLVIELKAEVKPQVFTIKPTGGYGHRLVLDLYPANPVDPVYAFAERSGPLEDDDTAVRREPERKHRERTEPVRAEREPHRERRKASRPDDEPEVARLVTIVLDPGHGGEDPGAIGAGGSQEKQVTLQVARRLRAKIDSQPNMRSIMTRDSDFFVPLGQRVEKAQRAQADLFVSIHADAFISPQARGSSVFALSERGATSAAAKWMAQRENESDRVGGVRFNTGDVHLSRVLADLTVTAKINDSLKLGRAVLNELGGVNRLHKDSVEQAGFAVLKAPDIPSILVETAFISNPEEEKRLNDEAYQDRIADAIFRGIRRYLAKNPPLCKSKVA